MANRISDGCSEIAVPPSALESTAARFGWVPAAQVGFEALNSALFLAPGAVLRAFNPHRDVEPF